MCDPILNRNLVEKAVIAETGGRPNIPAWIPDVRKKVAIPKPAFDRAIIDLAQTGRYFLHRHSYPASSTQQELAELVVSGRDVYCVIAARRREYWPDPASMPPKTSTSSQCSGLRLVPSGAPGRAREKKMNQEINDLLIQELTELRDRLNKLSGLIASNGFDPLDQENRFLLCQQELVMQQYEKILMRRIFIN
jgi:hypothetical protein